MQIGDCVHKERGRGKGVYFFVIFCLYIHAVVHMSPLPEANSVIILVSSYALVLIIS